MKELTLKEVQGLLESGYSRESVAALLRQRGADSSISAKDVISLLATQASDKSKSLFDISAQQYGNMPASEFNRWQEKLTVWVWLPLALATICTLLLATRGVDVDVSKFLSAWGLRRLSRITKRVEPTKEERDEAFLKALGV